MKIEDGGVVVGEATDQAGMVVVLTALNLEYRAVRGHLADVALWRHPNGTLFEVGRLRNTRRRVAIAVIGEGNTTAGVLTERAIAQFEPDALLFVGVAGALKDDIGLGDVIVATRVYAYHGGKDNAEGFLTRPRAWETPHHLEQLARHVAVTGSWTSLLSEVASADPPTIHFKPIAAGEVVLNSRTSPLALQIRRHYSDAAAIEMESAGVAHAGHLNHSTPVLTVRGISDTAGGDKHLTDLAGWQPIAAANAAAFALALVEALPVVGDSPSRIGGAKGKSSGVRPTRVQNITVTTGSQAFVVMDGNQYVQHDRPDGETSEAAAHDDGRR